MPSARSATHELMRLLQAISQPLCLIDEDRRIVFVNDACARWLRVDATDLLSRICRYQSGDSDPLAAAADALCPPPQVFAGLRGIGTIAKPTGHGPLERRRAEFIPLESEAGNCIGAMVLINRENLIDEAINATSDGAVSSSSPVADEAEQLHTIVQRFRREMNAWHHLNRLAGTSSGMTRVRAQVKLAAAGRGTVIIAGPPGIGRQHIARSIHAASAQSAGPFTPVSCSALPPDLLRSTIATLNVRRGNTDGDSTTTLLLLDVDRLPAELQHEVAQWLTSPPRGLRIISTSAEPLDRLVERGEFRADLAYLLATLVIELPPLASRREDIPILAQMFLEDLNAQGSKQLRGFTAEAMDRLSEYDWPGQTDELAAMVREAAAQAEGFEVTPPDLPKRLRQAAEATRFARRPAEPIELESFLGRVEKELIERAMREAKGNKSQAARLLGLTRPRLYRRMVQLGLEQDESDNDDAV